MRRPSTGSFQIAVRTALPSQGTSRGPPTLRTAAVRRRERLRCVLWVPCRDSAAAAAGSYRPTRRLSTGVGCETSDIGALRIPPRSGFTRPPSRGLGAREAPGGVEQTVVIGPAAGAAQRWIAVPGYTRAGSSPPSSSSTIGIQDVLAGGAAGISVLRAQQLVQMTQDRSSGCDPSRARDARRRPCWRAGYAWRRTGSYRSRCGWYRAGSRARRSGPR